MQFGDMKFKQRPREEQAEADGTAEAEKVTHPPTRGFHKCTKLAMLAEMPTLYSQIFAASFFICFI